MNKVNPFPAFTAPFPFIFLLSLFIVFKAILLTSPGKLSLSKGIATFASALLSKLPHQEAKDSSG